MNMNDEMNMNSPINMNNQMNVMNNFNQMNNMSNCNMQMNKKAMFNSFVNDFDRREDFLRLRNVGRRSIEEIMMKLFLYTYDNLKPEKRKAYLEKVREMN